MKKGKDEVVKEGVSLIKAKKKQKNIQKQKKPKRHLKKVIQSHHEPVEQLGVARLGQRGGAGACLVDVQGYRYWVSLPWNLLLVNCKCLFESLFCNTGQGQWWW